jgi:hypothetical protein
MKTNQEIWTELRAQLAKNLCEITFTKVDGTLRTMPCTLKRELLPEVALNEHHKTKAVNYDVLSVWCTDKQAWRSFRVENVTNVTVLS